MMHRCPRAQARNLCLALLASLAGLGATPAFGLGLEEATALALQEQPALQSLHDQARSQRQLAVAAGELPDPSLMLGISEIPINSSERWSLRRDGDTDVMLGLRQAFPRAEKRELRRERLLREAEAQEADADATARLIRREVSLAWLGIWEQTRAQSILKAQLGEAEQLSQTLRIAYSAGQVSQARVLDSELASEALREQIEARAQQEQAARHQLARWIGPDAFRALTGEPPLATPPDPAAMATALEEHPHLLADLSRAEMARTEVALARADFRPDWALSFSVGYRPEFSEMGSVQLEIPLPLFTARRQNPRLEAALARESAQQARLEDLLREHRAHIHRYADEWRDIQARIARHDDALLPKARARIRAEQDAYRAGSAELTGVFQARQAVLQLELARLALHTEAARHQARLRYFAP